MTKRQSGSRAPTKSEDNCELSVHELVMPNASDSLHDIRAFTSAAISGLPLSKSAAWDVVLAVGEAATNCVLHGQNSTGSHNTITTRIRSAHDRVRVELHDSGSSFHPDVSGWPAPGLTDEKGRGIFIMKTLMDRVEYPSVGNGTLCVLTKKFNRSL